MKMSCFLPEIPWRWPKSRDFDLSLLLKLQQWNKYLKNYKIDTKIIKIGSLIEDMTPSVYLVRGLRPSWKCANLDHMGHFFSWKPYKLLN